MANDDIIRAGAVILKDLSLFNRAGIFFEEQIEPLIRTEVGDLAGKWIREKFWKGETDVSDSFTDMWVCPAAWEENEDEPYARFYLGYRDAEATNSYEIADLFGAGQTDFGFRFTPDYSWFGGKSAWNPFAKTMSEQAEKIARAGWINEGKGIFFRPVSLVAANMVEAWENEDWSEALAPLGAALDSLEADQALFDTVLRQA